MNFRIHKEMMEQRDQIQVRGKTCTVASGRTHVLALVAD